MRDRTKEKETNLKISSYLKQHEGKTHLERFTNLFKDGESLYSLATEIGVQYNSVYRFAKKAGFDFVLNNPKRWTTAGSKYETENYKKVLNEFLSISENRKFVTEYNKQVVASGEVLFTCTRCKQEKFYNAIKLNIIPPKCCNTRTKLVYMYEKR